MHTPQALLRAGRFDARVLVGPPETESERLDVLRVLAADVLVGGGGDGREAVLQRAAERR